MRFSVLLGIALALSLACSAPGPADAQSGIVWSAPQRLSNPDRRSGTPAIVADAAGNIHVMWSEEVTDLGLPSEGDTLFYSRWDGKTWTQAIDVLALPGQGAQFPALAVTPDGMLHAVWSTGGRGQVMYARAPACCADNPHNWSAPVSLGGPVLQTVALAADNRGRLHLAFAPTDAQVIIYRRSDDGGLTWPQWVEVAGGAREGDEYTTEPRLATDGADRVHLVWIVEPWPGRYAMYAQSEDGGDTWSSARVIDRFDSGEYSSDGYGPEFIDVEAQGDEVHLLWDGAPTVERHHIWSSDGGSTWSEPQLLFPEVKDVGRAGWNDMVFDSAGSLHAISLGKPWHASWSGEQWSPSQDVSRADEQAVPGGEWVGAAVRLGNELNVVWIDKFKKPFTVWHASRRINVPEVPAKELPMMQPPAAESEMAAPTPMPTEDLTTTRAVLSSQAIAARAFERAPRSESSDTAGIMAGVIAAMLVVGVVLMASVRRKTAKG